MQFFEGLTNHKYISETKFFNIFLIILKKRKNVRNQADNYVRETTKVAGIAKISKLETILLAMQRSDAASLA